MSRNGSGTAVKAVPDFVASTIISESKMNLLINDIIDMLTQSMSKDGQTVVTGDIPMGIHKLINLVNGSNAADSINLGQAQSESMVWTGVATGTADDLTLTMTPAITSYVAGMRVVFIASASPNTGPVTIDINSAGAKDVKNSGVALSSGNIEADKMYQIIYDGTDFQIMKIAL